MHIVGSVDDVLAAHKKLVHHLRDIELTVNPAKCSLLYFHSLAHPLTAAQLSAVTGAGLQWGGELAADVLGAVVGADAAAIAEHLHSKLGGAGGLFGPFFRRVQSGGFAVQDAMLLLAHSVSRLAYLQRCLPTAAIERVAHKWDGILLAAAVAVLNLTADEVGDSAGTLRRPLRLGGFGLTSARFTSPLAFIGSIAASAAQPGVHALSDGTLPTASELHGWLRDALTCPTVVDIFLSGCVPA